jgi:hypothetical protein
MLARVRALLAKAESTAFPEEAEALSTKAQELMARHSIDLLVPQQVAGPSRAPADIAVRRLWIDQPYVRPKAMLAHQVALANRASAVLSEGLGFVTLVGTTADLDGIELLVTSLLVQADTAMLRAGRHVGLDGRSRTRSFRRSFLVSYASRIGERLVEVDRTVAEVSGRSAELVPLLREHEERVAARIEELFPHTIKSRRAPVGNLFGWAEGRAAADLALLDTRAEVTREAG